VSPTRLLPALLVAAAACAAAAQPSVPPRLGDGSDRAAFRAWFTTIAELQFERPSPEVVDCAALVRFAYREALRPHTAAWVRRIGLPQAPAFADVRGGPQPGPRGWPLFLVRREPPAFAEFADARTIVSLNARPVGRDPRRAQPGDLLYFQQPGQRQPDHLMVVIGRSAVEPHGHDWIVYHTGPDDEGPGEVRKVRLADLERHPAPRWRPLAGNARFVGVFRLALL
jgi:uncharacterized protein YfaT (DUF1175 family)